MFDALSDAVFWPLFMLAWFAAGLAVALFFGRVVDMTNPRRNRYEGEDKVAERHRRLARNGFKSKQGIR